MAKSNDCIESLHFITSYFAIFILVTSDIKMTKRKQIIITSIAALIAFLIMLAVGNKLDGRLIGSVIVVTWMITSISRKKKS